MTADGIEIVRVVRATAPKALTAKEFHALVREARRSGFRRDRPRNYALVQLLVQTGLRLGELVALRWEDLEIRERIGWLRVRAGKGFKERMLPLNATARKVLCDWRRAVRRRLGRVPERVACGAGGQPLTGRAVQHLLTELAARARLPHGKVTPHVMRHTMAAMYLSRYPGDVVRLAALLGHESIATTSIYTKPSAEDLAEKMEGHPANAYARLSIQTLEKEVEQALHRP